MNEHRDAREVLELAAAEPGGLDRLEAGDTAEAIAVAGHLAGCPDCLEELARLRRAETLLRPVIASEPDPALRERTLALIREVGVQRGAPTPARPAATRAAAAAGATGTEGRAAAPGRPRRTVSAAVWATTMAATLLVGLLGGVLLAGNAAPRGNADPAAALAAIAQETATLLATGDARQVTLRDASGAPAGTLVLSPASDRMVVSATGLAAPRGGSEYRCWVEVGGERTALGTMWWAGGVAWWRGGVDLPAELPAGVAYGVSLVEATSSGPGAVVLTGRL